MTEKDKEINELRREVASLQKNFSEGLKKAYIDGYMTAISNLGALKAEAERVKNEISQPENKDV